MRSFILLSACLGNATADESSSLMQMRLHRQDNKVGADPTKKAEREAAKEACAKSCLIASAGWKTGKSYTQIDKRCKSAYTAGACTEAKDLPKRKKCKKAVKEACLADGGDETTCKKKARKAWTGTSCNTPAPEPPAPVTPKPTEAPKPKPPAPKPTEAPKPKPPAPKPPTPPKPYVPEPEPVDPGYETPYVCGAWGDWGECSAPCGGGLQTREFKFIDGNKCGTDCPHGDGDKDQRPCNSQECPVDCEGEWSSYGSCSATCGGGDQIRVFTITTPASNGGKECPFACGTQQVHKCSTEPCEWDCEGHWEDWGCCSGPGGADCGAGGQKNRTYVVDKKESKNGCKCPHEDGEIEKEDCDLPCCAKDCEGDWGAFGTCEGPKLKWIEAEGGYGTTCCGGGTKTKTFSITSPKECGGKCCEAADGDTVTVPCCETECPIDCEGHWEPPCACSKTCGNGTKTSTFVVDVPAQFGGEQCKWKHGAKKVEPCFLKECPEHCEGKWGPWGPCDTECESDGYGGGQPSPLGHQTRKFIVTKFPKYGGDNCSEWGEEQVVPCGPPASPEKPEPCPIPAVCKWAEWGECSANCSNGPDHYIFRKRKWIQIKAAKYGGKECINNPPAYEPDEEPCDKPRCPIDCIGKWGPFDDCTAKKSVPGGWYCGGGSKTRRYTITRPAAFGGRECCNSDGDEDSVPCGDRCCEVPCIGEWSEWGDCCVSCGNGTRSRSFEVSQPAKCGGAKCVETVGYESVERKDGDKQVESCNEQGCPQDCEGDWSPWTPCSQKCTDCESGYGTVGSKTRKFTVRVPMKNNGKSCKWADGATQEKTCNDKCCKVDCKGSWSELSECSKSCGNGIKKKTYTITQPAKYGGKECPKSDNCTWTEECNEGACPIDCVGKWSDWSHCCKECGGGQKTSWFVISTPAQNGGKPCKHAAYDTKKQDCNTHDCFQPCIGGFGLWSKCSADCSGGTRNRTYTVKSAAKGLPTIDCPHADGFVQTEKCNEHKCPSGYDCPPGKPCNSYDPAY